MRNTNARRAHTLTKKEWAQLAAVEELRHLWPLLDEEDSATELAESAYGVRFEFESEEFSGDLYILQGLYGMPPVVLSQASNGLLGVVELEDLLAE